MKKLFIIFIATVFTVSHTNATSTKAVCVVPIADLIGEAAQATAPRNPEKSYKALPLAAKNFNAPARVHQLLFNEVVTIQAVRGQEALVELPNLFYETATHHAPQTQYWTLRSNLRTFDQLKKSGVTSATFPEPLTRNKEQFTHALHNTVSLTHSFFDATTNTTYSAGTRFIVQGSTNSQVVVRVFDARTNKEKSMTLPKKVCLLHEEKSEEQRIADFVTLVTSWAHADAGFIPYVWGGCSIGQLCTQDQFSSHQGVFTRQELSPQLPMAGLDCTGLVARAAHLAGIPYFYKNSFTLAKYLEPLKKNDVLAEGDLIWIPGHVMVVSSLKNGLLVEARHYHHGYGKVHEIPLSQEFLGIKGYQDLVATFFAKKPIKRLDKTGTVVQVIPEFKLLKLASVWRK